MKKWKLFGATCLLAAALAVNGAGPALAVEFIGLDDGEDIDDIDEFDEEDLEDPEVWDEEDWGDDIDMAEDYPDEEDWEDPEVDEWIEEDDYNWEGAVFVYRGGGAQTVDQEVFGQVGTGFLAMPTSPLDFGLLMPANGIDVDSILLAKPNFYQREGYIFTGWALYETDGETWYCMDDEGWSDQVDIDEMGCEKLLVQPGEDLLPYLQEAESPTILLYAQWRRMGFTLSFKGGKEAEGEMKDVLGCLSGVPVRLEKNAFTREGYVMTGWAAKRTSDGACYCGEEEGWLSKEERKRDGVPVMVFEDGGIAAIPCEFDRDTITLVAQWAEKTQEDTAQAAAQVSPTPVPAADTLVQEVQEPAAEATTQEPVAEGTAQEPMAEGAVQEPAAVAEGTSQEPTLEAPAQEVTETEEDVIIIYE